MKNSLKVIFMSFSKDFKDVLLKVIAGLFVALIIAICQYFYKHPDFHLSWVLLSPMQLLEEIYFRFSIPMRLNIYFWLNTFFIYYILDKYDQNYEVDKKRTVKEHNFNSGSFLIYSLFVGIGLLNIDQFKLIENEIGIFIVNAFGLLATFTGFLILVLGRVALDGRWGPHIYNYSDKSLRKLVTTVSTPFPDLGLNWISNMVI